MKNRETSRERSLRNLKPFKKGQSGNPRGRLKGQKDARTLLREALKKKEEETGVSFCDLLVERAYQGNSNGIRVLCELAKKTLPDLIEVEQTTTIEAEVIARIEAMNERLDERIREVDRIEETRALAAPSPGWNRLAVESNGGNGKKSE